jgi:hypothetical protein
MNIEQTLVAIAEELLESSKKEIGLSDASNNLTVKTVHMTTGKALTEVALSIMKVAEKGV